VSMHTTSIESGFTPIVEWRVSVTYLGDGILIDPPFVASMSSTISALGGVHAQSLWISHGGLVTVSHAPAIEV
jgi:hypothetical protein